VQKQEDGKTVRVMNKHTFFLRKMNKHTGSGRRLEALVNIRSVRWYSIKVLVNVNFLRWYTISTQDH
jgi:hypothetical protein